jgi:hypothetical protein
MFRRLVFLVFAAMLLLPLSAVAQDVDVDEDDDVLIRITGPVSIPADQSIDVVVAINNDAVIDGTITEALIIIDGTATINGRVDGDLVVISGDVTLGPSAVVENVHLYDSEMVRDPAATISGDLNENAEFTWSWWDSAIFTFAIWIGMTIVVLVAGLIFALFGGRQLVALAETARRQIGLSVLTALVLLVGLPLAAIGAFFTVIGIPLGLVILLLVIPLLWFVGYIIIGSYLGMWIRSLMGRTDSRSGVVWSTLIGLLVLQLIGLIPFIGGFVAFLAGLYGSGVLVYHLIRRRGGEPAHAGPVQSALGPAD